MSLCHFCDYYVIITSHSYVASMRGQILLNLLLISELCFKCSMSSLAVVFFLRPFLRGILTFRIIVETVCKHFTLFHSKWETKLRYQGQLNHPTPRMTNKIIMLYFTQCALGAPASDDLSVLEKKEDMLFFYLI